LVGKTGESFCLTPPKRKTLVKWKGEAQDQQRVWEFKPKSSNPEPLGRPPQPKKKVGPPPKKKTGRGEYPAPKKGEKLKNSPPKFENGGPKK